MPRLVALPGETAQNDAALARSTALAVQYDLSQPLLGHRQVQRQLHLVHIQYAACQALPGSRLRPVCNAHGSARIDHLCLINRPIL
jgi:hypothetical protein